MKNVDLQRAQEFREDLRDEEELYLSGKIDKQEFRPEKFDRNKERRLQNRQDKRRQKQREKYK
jgi:hypothetical protein